MYRIYFYVSGLKSNMTFDKSNYFAFNYCAATDFIIEPSSGIGKDDKIDSNDYCNYKDRAKIAVEVKNSSVTLFDLNGKPLYTGSLTSNANKNGAVMLQFNGTLQQAL